MTADEYADVGDGFDRVAPGWDKWSEVTGQRDPGRYFRAARVRPGHRVLEIGAGTGDQALALARLIGPDGRVLAVDISSEMLAVAERRALAAGLDNIDFHVGPIGELDLGSSEFDAAISGFTWLFLPDPVADAAVVLNALKPGGRFAASVWGRVPEVPMMALPMRAVLEGLGMDTGEPFDNAPSPLADPAEFGSVLTEAGFVDVTVDGYRVDFTFDTSDQFADWVFDIILPITDLIEEHAPGRQDEFHTVIANAAATQSAGDGSVTLSNPAFMASGSRGT